MSSGRMPSAFNIDRNAMQIPHRSLVGFLAGIGPWGWQHASLKMLLERTKPTRPQTRPSPALTSPLLLKGEPALGDANRSPSWNSVISSAATAVAFTNGFSTTQTPIHRHRPGSLCPQRSAFALPPPCPPAAAARWRANRTATGMCMPPCSTSKTAWIAKASSIPQRKS